MDNKIFVYPVEGTYGNGHECVHAIPAPKKPGDIVLCEKCAAAVSNGAVIEKRGRKHRPTLAELQS